MANELCIVIEDRLRELRWSVPRFTLESGLSVDVVVDLVGREQLPVMPDEDTLRKIATALDLPYRQLVVAAGIACGLPKDHEDEPAFVMRFVTNQELLNELRRRLARGCVDSESEEQRRTHLALVKEVLSHEAS